MQYQYQNAITIKFQIEDSNRKINSITITTVIVNRNPKFKVQIEVKYDGVKNIPQSNNNVMKNKLHTVLTEICQCHD